MGADLVSQIPSRLELIGVRGAASVAYQQASFICIEVNLHSVDIFKLIGINAGEEKSEKLKTFFDKISIPALTSLAEVAFLHLVANKVLKQLPQTVQSKLQDKLIAQVEIVTLTDAEQGPFLIETIRYH